MDAFSFYLRSIAEVVTCQCTSYATSYHGYSCRVENIMPYANNLSCRAGEETSFNIPSFNIITTYIRLFNIITTYIRLFNIITTYIPSFNINTTYIRLQNRYYYLGAYIYTNIIEIMIISPHTHAPTHTPTHTHAPTHTPTHTHTHTHPHTHTRARRKNRRN